MAGERRSRWARAHSRRRPFDARVVQSPEGRIVRSGGGQFQDDDLGLFEAQEPGAQGQHLDHARLDGEFAGRGFSEQGSRSSSAWAKRPESTARTARSRAATSRASPCASGGGAGRDTGVGERWSWERIGEVGRGGGRAVGAKGSSGGATGAGAGGASSRRVMAGGGSGGRDRMKTAAAPPPPTAATSRPVSTIFAVAAPASAGPNTAAMSDPLSARRCCSVEHHRPGRPSAGVPSPGVTGRSWCRSCSSSTS